MDPRLLRHYNTELGHLCEMGAEFARDYPKIAGRLGLDSSGSTEVADPYVERLLEGSAFLAARVQLKLEEEFPRFTQRMMQIVLPQTIAPTPSMLVAQLQPDLGNPNLAHGFTVPRGTALVSHPAHGTSTACEFRTGADLTLWPLEVANAACLPLASDLPLATMSATAPLVNKVRAVLRVHLRLPEGQSFDTLKLDTLSLFFGGGDELAWRLHELVTSSTLAVTVSPPARPVAVIGALPGDAVSCCGFDDAEALLPDTPQAFRGYRHLREYFAFAPRFRFARLAGLSRVLPLVAGRDLELNFLLARADAQLERSVAREHVLLGCVPAINLFTKRPDRTFVSDAASSFHVVSDRSRPLDFEVHSVMQVRGYGSGNEREQNFAPFYAAFHDARDPGARYFTMERMPRTPVTARVVGRRESARRTDYVGSEVFVSIVDSRHAPYSRWLRQLAFDTLCTNRDLPLLMPLGRQGTDFTLDIAAPVHTIRCVSGPSRPIAALLELQDGWRLVDHLSLNYLSLLDANPEEGAAALRSLLQLHVADDNPSGCAQANAVRSVRATPVVRRLRLPGPISYGRGLAIELLIDEPAFAGASAHLFGQVLDSFLARYVSINSFVETTVRGDAHRDIYSGRPRCGIRQTL